MKQRPTVLLVEENANAQVFMGQALQQAEYRVIAAADAEDGWQQATYEQPECIIIDPVLPGRSGFELCRQIRLWDTEHYFAIILLGSKESPVDRAWSLRQGADVYLARPFTDVQLVQVVNGLVPLAAHAPTPAPSPYKSAAEIRPDNSQQTFQWGQVVLHRLEDPNLMTADNPFSSSQVIADKQARRVYAAIDGRKTLQELALALNLDWKTLTRALQVLYMQERIQLRTADGQLIDSAWLWEGMG
jgi:twitching motility two-component system response regulator PilH